MTLARWLVLFVGPFAALLVGAVRPNAPDLPAPEVVFAVRPVAQGHWYENFGFYSNEPARPAFTTGGRLCVLNTVTGAVRTLLDDPKGGVRDPQVHYDGRRIVFSYRKGGADTYHLYEIQSDGSGLKQLTDGPDDDMEPCYLPDGGIVFVSSRCHRFVNCWFTRVGVLYRCNGDGSGIRQLSASIEHDNTPSVLPDGRILYMRWEYVDRSQVDFHHLWTMNPDGTNQTIYYGNLRPSTVMLDARPVPGSRQVVASFSPYHGLPEHMGWVTLVDPGMGPDDPAAARRISKSEWYRDPFPLADGRIVAAIGKSIVLMEPDGSTRSLYDLRDPNGALEVHEPRLLAPRPREQRVTTRMNPARSTGTLAVSAVHLGRGMAGVQPGEIKRLLVLEQLPKPVNFSGGMEPLTLGGSFTLARILGTVPVEPDGSAHFEVPAMTPLFLVALDAAGLSVKRMQSFLAVQPGERLSCLGCHEQRTRTSASAPEPLALRRAPSVIEPLRGVPAIPDFPRDIQPILDRRCVQCHSTDKASAGLNLSGDRTPSYSTSYELITYRGLVADGRNQARGNRPARSIGTSASRLLTLMDGTHHGATVPAEELAVVRAWIETGATYPGTYAALGCGMVWPPLPFVEMQQRCGPCHTSPAPDRKAPGQSLFFRGVQATVPTFQCNLSRPDRSAMLMAPLSPEAGGSGACGKPIFAGKDDPLYRLMLAAITQAARTLDQDKRFDMPGFQPNAHYLREMRRFGALPAPPPPGERVDPYQADEAYWRLFRYQAEKGKAAK